MAALLRYAKLLGGNIDLEFVFDQQRIILLQHRPWVGAQQMLPSDSNEEAANEYFPKQLLPLVGDLWALALSTRPNTLEGRHVNGHIKLSSNRPETNVQPRLGEPSLKETYLGNHRMLFPAWRKSARALSSIAADITTGATSTWDGWIRAKRLWISFYDSYFHNEFEAVMSAARESATPGSGLPAGLRIFLARSQEAARTNKFDRWLQHYGEYFVNCHYFNVMTAAEDKSVMTAYISSYSKVSNARIEKKMLLHRVADIAYEDNRFKHLLNAGMRRVLLACAVKHLGTPADIWHCRLTDLEEALRMQRALEPIRGVPRTGTDQGDHRTSQRFASLPLTRGVARGSVCCKRDTEGRGQVLICPTVSDVDYGRMLSAAGVVIAFGSPTSHAALLAAENGIPMHVCPEAVSFARDGDDAEIDGLGRVVDISPP
jgi:phosphohistidine swiveling domain-containing protein